MTDHDHVHVYVGVLFDVPRSGREETRQQVEQRLRETAETQGWSVTQLAVEVGGED